MVEEIKDKVFQTSDGRKFLDIDEASLHQGKINNTKYYEVYFRKHQDYSENSSGFIDDIANTLGSVVQSYIDKVSFRRNYIGVVPENDDGHEMMIEQVMYEKYGNKIGQSRNGDRFERWGYKEVSHGTVLNQKWKNEYIIDEYTLRSLQLTNKRDNEYEAL